MPHGAQFRSLLAIIVLPLMTGAVCVPQGSVDGVVGEPGGECDGLRIRGEPNDSFDEALCVSFSAEGSVQILGSVNTTKDVDVYMIGALSPGDRIIVDLGSHDDDLDASVAIFDEGGRLIIENDDRNIELNQLDPFVNLVNRRESSINYLAVSSSPLGPSTGSYDVILRILRENAALMIEPQIVALDFDGGTIVISPERVYTTEVFNTADISPAYAGLTSAVRQRIIDVVIENYDGLALDIREIPGDDLPEGCTYSTIYFGGANPSAFGIAQEVDSFNQEKCDEAIVFTDMFTPSRFGMTLSANELGTAIGNVAAHEIGHLLGLNHVADPSDIMDTVGGPSTFLDDQEFTNAILDDTIFYIGTQDSWLLLLETIGAL